MKSTIFQVALMALALGVDATPAAAPQTTPLANLASKVKRGTSLPASSGTSVLKAVQTIAAGKSFDGGMKMYDRGVSCTGQSEGGDSDAVFQIEAGGSLSNVIIGPNQIEGVHCQVSNISKAISPNSLFSFFFQRHQTNSYNQIGCLYSYQCLVERCL